VIRGFLRAAETDKVIQDANASAGQSVGALTYLAGPRYASNTREGIEKTISAAAQKQAPERSDPALRPPNQILMYLFFGDAVTMGLGMKKVDRIRDLLMEGYTPRQVAERVPCALSLVYEVRGKSDLARLRHQVAELRLGMRDLFDRVAVLEGKPAGAIERLEQRRHA